MDPCCWFTRVLGEASLPALGSRATPGCLSLPLHLQVLSLSEQELCPGGHKQPMGACVKCRVSEFSGAGWFGRAPHFTACMAEGEASTVPSKQHL